jgi:hypothetical protein
MSTLLQRQESISAARAGATRKRSSGTVAANVE